MESSLQLGTLWAGLILCDCFNPCFNGIFSSIGLAIKCFFTNELVSILVLMESSLQCWRKLRFPVFNLVSILVLMESSLQFVTDTVKTDIAESFNPCFNGIFSSIISG